jgi:hypothetical protein
MKPKKSFRENEFLAKTAATMEELKPVYQKSYNTFKQVVEKKPYKTLGIMITISVINLSVLLFMSYRSSSVDLGFSKMNFSKIKSSTLSTPGPTNVPFTFENYFQIKKLKDSLDYLMSKKPLSKNDTLLFIRICQQYSKLDPQFKQIILKQKP